MTVFSSAYSFMLKRDENAAQVILRGKKSCRGGVICRITVRSTGSCPLFWLIRGSLSTGHDALCGDSLEQFTRVTMERKEGGRLFVCMYVCVRVQSHVSLPHWFIGGNFSELLIMRAWWTAFNAFYGITAVSRIKWALNKRTCAIECNRAFVVFDLFVQIVDIDFIEFGNHLIASEGELLRVICYW